MLETLNEQPLACDSQDLLGIEDRRKERNVFHVILPQSLSQGKHLLHAHLGQLPGKHATLKRSVEKEKGGWTLDGSARPQKPPWSSAVGFTVTYLQGGLVVFRVVRRMRLWATS